MTTALSRAITVRTRHDTHKDAGTIAMWSVITAMALLIMMGLVVDGGGKVQAKQRAEQVAEEAARGAGQAIIEPLAVRGTSIVVNPLTAQLSATKYLAAAGIPGVVVPTGPTTLLITTTTVYQPRVLGLIGVGPQQIIGTATVNLNRTNIGVPGLP
jgi:Flp pilus assembly protein TadG